MMYRSGRASKKGQERVLAIDVTREGFECPLARGIRSAPRLRSVRRYDRARHGKGVTVDAVTGAEPCQLALERAVCLGGEVQRVGPILYTPQAGHQVAVPLRSARTVVCVRPTNEKVSHSSVKAPGAEGQRQSSCGRGRGLAVSRTRRRRDCDGVQSERRCARAGRSAACREDQHQHRGQGGTGMHGPYAYIANRDTASMPAVLSLSTPAHSGRSTPRLLGRPDIAMMRRPSWALGSCNLDPASWTVDIFELSHPCDNRIIGASLGRTAWSISANVCHSHATLSPLGRRLARDTSPPRSVPVASRRAATRFLRRRWGVPSRRRSALAGKRRSPASHRSRRRSTRIRRPRSCTTSGRRGAHRIGLGPLHHRTSHLEDSRRIG